MNRFVSILSVAVVLHTSNGARADAIPPPPTNCTTGTVGGSDHNCEFCAARTCSDQSPCAAGTSCQAVKLCAGYVTCFNQTGSGTRSHISGPCPGGTCGEGTCQSFNVCMQQTPDSGCSCELAARPAAAGSALLLLLAAAVLHGRRRPGAWRA